MSTQRGDEAAHVRAGGIVQPEFGKDAFNCVICHAFAEQKWRQLKLMNVNITRPIWETVCSRCNGYTYWYQGDWKQLLIYPPSSTAPPAHPDMPADVLADYKEAATIVDLSPRGAGALLRLALQKLMPHLGEGSHLDTAIGNLVKDGLDVQVQKALDALRVIGNHAVHPGELDLTDDREKVGMLFTLLNYIVDARIRQPREVNAIYSSLPAGALAAIERRDQKQLSPGDDS